MLVLVLGWVGREIDVEDDRIMDTEVKVGLLKLSEPWVRASGAASIVASLEFLAVGGG